MDLLTYTTSPGMSATALAAALEVPAVLILQWRGGTRAVPIARCPSIERETGGKVTCEELRPDVTWTRVRDRKWPHPDGRPLVDFGAEATA